MDQPLYCISIIIIIIAFPKKKLTNKYTKKISTRVGTIVDRKKVLKQAVVLHDIKSQ